MADSSETITSFDDTPEVRALKIEVAVLKKRNGELYRRLNLAPNDKLREAFERHDREVDSRTDAESEAILRSTKATDEAQRIANAAGAYSESHSYGGDNPKRTAFDAFFAGAEWHAKQSEGPTREQMRHAIIGGLSLSTDENGLNRKSYGEIADAILKELSRSMNENGGTKQALRPTCENDGDNCSYSRTDCDETGGFNCQTHPREA